MTRIFSRPGFSTISVEDDNLETAYAVARDAWAREAEDRAKVLEITAAEYSCLARRGLVAEHVRANAERYAAKAETPAQLACAASLFRQAARVERPA